MRKGKRTGPRPYCVPSGFRVACRGFQIKVEDALQQFADAITVNAWLQKDGSEVSQLACDFLRHCALDTSDKYHQEVHFSTTERSLVYLKQLEDILQSDASDNDKEELYLKTLCQLFIYIDNRMAPDYMSCQYNIKVSRDFLMLCDVLYLNSDYVLFLYMINVGIGFQEVDPLDEGLCLCKQIFNLSCENPKVWEPPVPEVLECLYRR